MFLIIKVTCVRLIHVKCCFYVFLFYKTSAINQLLITAFLKQVWNSKKFWLFDPYSEVKLSIIPLFNVPNLRQLLFTFLFASFWNWSNILIETVFWSELRFDEGGRYVVCSLNKNEKDFKVWTPKDFNARTKVHEYGGGAFFVYDGAVYFSNFSDQQMYVQKSPDSSPEAITPKDCNWRYADGSLCSKVIILIWIFKNINWTVFRYHIFITCLHVCIFV